MYWNAREQWCSVANVTWWRHGLRSFSRAGWGFIHSTQRPVEMAAVCSPELREDHGDNPRVRATFNVQAGVLHVLTLLG